MIAVAMRCGDTIASRSSAPLPARLHPSTHPAVGNSHPELHAIPAHATRPADGTFFQEMLVFHFLGLISGLVCVR